MHIASLVPGATEVVAALGKGASLVARSHDTFRRAETSSVPAVTSPAPGEPADPHGPITIDYEALTSAAPDVVFVSSHCAGCASGRAEATCRLPAGARVVSVEPHSLGGVMASLLDIGAAAGAEAEAARLALRIESRLDTLRSRVAGRRRPRVAVIVRADPIWGPGDWVPELVAIAGGENVLGVTGTPARPASHEELASAQPDVILFALHGYGLYEEQARLRHLARRPEWLTTSRSARVLAIDAASYLDRPGPGIVEGASLIAWALHRVYLRGRPPPGRIAELIEAGWADLAALPGLAEKPI